MLWPLIPYKRLCGAFHLPDFHFPDILPVDDEAQGRLYLVKSRNACGSRIQVQQPEFVVKDDLQNMRMSADEQLRRILEYAWFYIPVIISRITPDVRHPHGCLLAHETLVLRPAAADHASVDIAVDRS